MSKSKKREMVAFNCEKTMGKFITQAGAIVLQMSGSSYFSVPPIPYLTVTGHIDDLATAEAVVKKHANGAAAARDVVFNILKKDLQSYKEYVQSLADAASETTNAIAIIKASGFSLKATGVRIKPPLRAKQSVAAGEVKLFGTANGSKSKYDWQISVDDGASYSNLPSTIMAKTVVRGLSNVKSLFRFRSLSKNGLSEWSVAVMITQ